MRFVYDNPRQVPGEYNPVDYIAQISPTPLLLPARNDALTRQRPPSPPMRRPLSPSSQRSCPAGTSTPTFKGFDAIRADHIGYFSTAHVLGEIQSVT
jgi:uncharacterized protein